MEYEIYNIDNEINLDVKSIKVKNSNNYSIEFYTYGGYFHSVSIPYKNNIDATEDVLLGYGKFRDNINGHGCGHNLLGAASLLAATAIKDWLVQNNIKAKKGRDSRLRKNIKRK